MTMKSAFLLLLLVPTVRGFYASVHVSAARGWDSNAQALCATSKARSGTPQLNFLNNLFGSSSPAPAAMSREASMEQAAKLECSCLSLKFYNRVSAGRFVGTSDSKWWSAIMRSVLKAMSFLVVMHSAARMMRDCQCLRQHHA